MIGNHGMKKYGDCLDRDGGIHTFDTLCVGIKGIGDLV
jgi:hypothetical protein